MGKKLFHGAVRLLILRDAYLTCGELAALKAALGLRAELYEHYSDLSSGSLRLLQQCYARHDLCPGVDLVLFPPQLVARAAQTALATGITHLFFRDKRLVTIVPVRH